MSRAGREVPAKGNSSSLRSQPALIAFTVALAIGLSSCGGSARVGIPPPIPGRAIDRMAVDTGQVALGVNTPDAPSPVAARAFAQMAGRRPRILMWYQSWSEPLFYESQLRGAREQQAIPLINWLPGGSEGGSEYSLRAILLGRFDGYIRASARSAARWGGPMLIDFAHEMNIAGSAWSPGVNGNTASEYVRAWRHVVSIFRAEHAENVRWVWAPNTDCEGRCPFGQFYPGDRWVDWVGLDGYNSASSDGLPWREFEQVFGPSYRALTSITGKPVMIAETSSAERGGSKMRWILNMRRALLRSFPRVRALVWFNRADPGDWTINSSPGSLAAFREVMALPPFSGRSRPG